MERADSFVVDPHKWLFAPFDCAALVYREPAVARAAHAQHAEYLEVLSGGQAWNPSDYAFHLTRRARGLPFWFSLATYGTRRYGEAVEATLALTVDAAALIRAAPHLELVLEPELSVVVFRRRRLGAGGLPRVERPGPRRRHRLRGAHHLGRRDGAALLLREPAHHRRRRPTRHRLAGRRVMADLVVANAGLLVTMDDDRRELPGGWVAIDGGFVTARGRLDDGAAGRRAHDRRRRRPRHARAWSTPITTSTRTSPGPTRR